MREPRKLVTGEKEENTPLRKHNPIAEAQGTSWKKAWGGDRSWKTRRDCIY